MKKFFVSVFVVLTTFLTISAQQNSLKPNLLVQEAKKFKKSLPVELFKISKTRNDVNIPKEIESYSILDIDREGLKKFRKEKSNFISLTIPQEGRSDLTLELVEVQPFAEGFTVKTAPSMQIVEVNTGKHYRGIIKGQERSIAAISIFDDQIMGFISHPSATGNLVIGKLENSPEHILYQDDQISEKFNFDCQAKDKETEYTTDQLNGTNTGSRALSDCVRLYLEVDYDIYVNKGSTTTAVTNYVTGIFNQVSTLYANEQINTVVSEIVVWTQQSPYNSTSSINMLNAFTANRQGFNGDLAQLLSYKASGGVAYVDGLCRSNPDYSMGYAGIQSSYSNVPTYSWTVEVCAHEFGHLFGSQHTHACVWNGNNTAIDGCYTTEGGCANPGNPPATVGGTIMSYCHLTSSGINFSNGFGVQPGNVIRSEVTTATCLQACSGGGGGGNQCTENVLSLEIRTDNYPTETTWNIKNSAGAILYSGGPYNTPNTLNTISLCLPSACYTFNIIDGYGDGICCAYGSGYYNIKQGTATLITGGQFGATETKSFCASGTSSNLTLSTSAASVSSAAGNATVGVTSNVSWTASSNATTWCTVTPASGSNNGNLTVSYTANTSTSARMATITVSGSGINRTYVLTQSGNTPELTLSAAVATATSTAGSNTVGVTSNISWTATSNATTWCTVTPASGSNNGNLTVSYTANTSTTPRTATITVSGSAINRTYVLTQSGAQGPSCTDGIQNGQETGIDCGGPTCPACPPNNDVQITTLAGHYFETGWDGWTDGGVDCARVNTSSSPEGSFSIQLRDNDGEFSSMTSPVYNMSQFDSVTVEFKFRSTSFETNEDFWLRYYNGTTWNTVSAFTFPVNFANNVTYTRKIKLNGPLSSAGRFRFQADASDNTDVVYIDAIIIIGYKTNTQATCTDGVKNGQETGIDCGGPTCPVCPPTCTDGVKNGQETGIDCGGPTCPVCPPTCTDGVKNGQETGVDCGGPTCPSCPPTCTDGIQNGQETGVDCGGPTCPSCLPTCTDGVKNGQETGVDCGGPTCPSCPPTCTDGVKNGQETGVDCGGPTCPVCPPTCTDGIQNGQETGVDCGGPCPACNTGGSVTTISGHYFETGWDGWIDGGSDCYRYDGPLSPEGTYSIRLRDNSAEQSGMSSPNYNLTAYNTIQIEFKFRANGMEAGEDFWVMYFNGSTWSNVGTFVSGTGFFNNQLYTATVTLTGSFSSASKFRFQCDGSENDDEVYIDAVVIRAGTGSGSFENPIVIVSENEIIENESLATGIQISPNPANNMIKVQSDEDVRRVNIYNIAGQLVMSLNSENIESIDISTLHNGLYFVRVETEENVYTERLIKN